MKKLKCLMAALLSVGILASGAALTACGGNDDGVSTDDVKEIIKDQQTWDKAFEDIDWVNLSCHVSYDIERDGEGTVRNENYAKLTETAMYWKMGAYSEGYSSKNSDGAYSTYVRYGGDENYTLLNDTSDRYYQELKLQLVLQVSYADYFELFDYDEETKSFVCNDEIEVTVKLVAPGGVIEEDTMVCTNNVIKALNGKITYIKSDYNFISGDGMANNASLEYYDIGSTVVHIPDEVKDNAVPETVYND